MRVILVDDHGIVRQGLRSILEAIPEFDLVGEAATGERALALVDECHPDAVVLDLQLKGMSGLEVCRQIIARRPQTAVLILTAFFDKSLVDACLRAGARGYLLKDAENLHLPEQLRTVMQGQTALDPRAANLLAETLCQNEPSPDILTTRELEVLRLMAQGLSNKEIGGRLHLSENTIKGHLKELLVKVNARNRVQAVLLAKERGLL